MFVVHNRYVEYRLLIDWLCLVCRTVLACVFPVECCVVADGWAASHQGGFIAWTYGDVLYDDGRVIPRVDGVFPCRRTVTSIVVVYVRGSDCVLRLLEYCRFDGVRVCDGSLFAPRCPLVIDPVDIRLRVEDADESFRVPTYVFGSE